MNAMVHFGLRLLVLSVLVAAPTARADLIQISGHTTNQAWAGAFAGLPVGTFVRLEMDVTAPLAVVSIDPPSFAHYRVPGSFTIAGERWDAFDHLFLVIENGFSGRDGIVPQITAWHEGATFSMAYQILSSLDLVENIQRVPKTMPLNLLAPMTDENIGFFSSDVNLPGAGTAWVATDYRWIGAVPSVPESSALSLTGVLVLLVTAASRVVPRWLGRPTPESD
ncbi:MAG: hypothetical protein QM691_01720 [Opitutaceae bacterium]